MPALLEQGETALASPPLETEDSNPFSSLIPRDIIGGANGSDPAYQVVAGKFGEVPRAEIARPTELGAFAEFVPGPGRDVEMPAVEVDLGPFADLARASMSPTSETEKALAELPKPPPPVWVEWEKGIENVSGIPFHQVNNAVRVFGESAGRYIFNGLRQFELNRAKLMQNPTPEMIAESPDRLVLPDGNLMPDEQIEALEQGYAAELEGRVPEILANAEELKRRMLEAERNTPTNPALAETVPARLAAAAGPVTVMTLESLIPVAGLPLMVMHGALATEREVLDSGGTAEQAERAAVRSAIGLGIFGGASKLAAMGVAKLLPAGAKHLTKFVAQFTSQEAANETSSRAVMAWNTAADAPAGQKVQAAMSALKETTLEGTVMNAMFSFVHAARASRPLPARSQTSEQRSTDQPSVAPESKTPLSRDPSVSPMSQPEPTAAEQPRASAETPVRPASYQEMLNRSVELEKRDYRNQMGEEMPPDILLEAKESLDSPDAQELWQAIRKGRRATEDKIEEMTFGRLDFSKGIGDEGNVGHDMLWSAREGAQRLREIAGLSPIPEPPSKAGAVRPANAPEPMPAPERRTVAEPIAGDEPARTAGPGNRAADVVQPEPVSPELVPEYLRRDAEVERLLSTDAPVKPEMKMAAAEEGGAIFGKGGKRTTVKPKGVTAKGDTNFLRIEPGWKRLGKGLEREGTFDILGRQKNKVGQVLGKATRRQVDLAQEIYGQLQAKFVEPMKGRRKATEAAFDELEAYQAAKENGRPLPVLSRQAQRILTAWEDVAESTGNLARANGVQVFDPTTGGHRPMGNLGRTYLPRVMKPEVERAMRDPALKANTPLWNDLVDAFAKHRGISDVEAAKELRVEAGRFSSNDYMGNLERARTGQLPEIFYDYDLRRVAPRYIEAFSERMAQIISYGQRLGPRDAPTRPNLWDIARKEAADTPTQEWLNIAEDQLANVRPATPGGRAMARGQTLASGLLLSNPWTTVMRNLITGQRATMELFGLSRTVRAYIRGTDRMRRLAQAKEIGVVRDRLAETMHADRVGSGESFIDDAIREFSNAALKISGFNGSEVFVRSNGSLAALIFAEDAVAALRKNPYSRRSKEALAMFKRMGVDAEKVLAEGADWKTGAETRKFVRTAVRESQGGYRSDQVPLWANSDKGRFLVQYLRWGTQRARHIWEHGVKPAMGTEIEWHGKKMVRRDFAPLMRMGVTSVVLGETFGAAASILFGRDRRDASLSEIAEAWKEDEKRAVALAAERLINDIIMSGTFGVWSQPIDLVKSVKDQSRLKNPAEPPSMGSVKALMDLGQAAYDQDGRLTTNDVLQFAGKLAPGVTGTVAVARNVMDEPLYEAQNDVRTLRNAAKRWAKEEGLDVSPKIKGDFRKSERAPIYEPIKEALLVGDAQRARVLKAEFLNQQTTGRAKAVESLRASIKQSQPFRAGPYTATTIRRAFREWARRNLSRDDYEQTERIQERYVRAATAAGLW